MKDDIYTIKRLCEKLDQPRQKIRRRLQKHDVKAINEYTRVYNNVPLEYNHEAFLILAKEFDVPINDSHTATVQHCAVESTTSEQHRTAEKDDKDKLIKVLERQLEESNKSRSNLEKLLDQQQQLTLISNEKIETLRLEIKEIELEDKELKNKKEKSFFRRFFK